MRLTARPVWKLKPIEGFRFPRKGDPFSTSPLKHGGGAFSSLLPFTACMSLTRAVKLRHEVE
jgi:hypothetical protein